MRVFLSLIIVGSLSACANLHLTDLTKMPCEKRAEIYAAIKVAMDTADKICASQILASEKAN